MTKMRLGDWYKGSFLVISTLGKSVCIRGFGSLLQRRKYVVREEPRGIFSGSVGRSDPIRGSGCKPGGCSRYCRPRPTVVVCKMPSTSVYTVQHWRGRKRSSTSRREPLLIGGKDVRGTVPGRQRMRLLYSVCTLLTTIGRIWFATHVKKLGCTQRLERCRGEVCRLLIVASILQVGFR
jgi:hypothetical protein